MSIIESIIIAIVEGLTEFLPVSSTGHMIIAEKLMGMESTNFTKLYTVAIQLGAIMAVVVLYWKKFINFKSWQFYIKLVVAVIPALALGFLFSDKIDALLESPTTVAITLLLGGILFLFIDNFFKQPVIEKEEDISMIKAFIIGCWQCIAMIPGVSRSAATIIGGMQQKLTRSVAAEFSFFLAVPTMCAATGYKLLKEYKNIHTEEIKILAIGNLVAFVVAILAIKFFIGFLQKHGFKLFGYYRIVVGIALLVLIYTGYIKG
ncbi:MAG: undecaprenyl-diphosphate phosphatase [Sphingobacteriales bacterium]|nr:MAG: undecaprenyl-diphosphate phosphatase [Sphingobacteriales bacterium]